MLSHLHSITFLSNLKKKVTEILAVYRAASISRLKFRKIFLLQIFFRKIGSSCLVTVIALYSIDRDILLNVLFEVVLECQHLDYLRVKRDMDFCSCCCWKSSSNMVSFIQNGSLFVILGQFTSFRKDSLHQEACLYRAKGLDIFERGRRNDWRPYRSIGLTKLFNNRAGVLRLMLWFYNNLSYWVKLKPIQNVMLT